MSGRQDLLDLPGPRVDHQDRLGRKGRKVIEARLAPLGGEKLGREVHRESAVLGAAPRGQQDRREQRVTPARQDQPEQRDQQDHREPME